MYSKKGIIFGILLFVQIMVLRMILDSSITPGVRFLYHIPMFIAAVILVIIGSNIRWAIKNTSNKAVSVIVSFILFIALIDLFVWLIILLTSNPTLVNIFFIFFFLPFGYFFVPLQMYGDSIPEKEIFEQYDTDDEEEDIFDVYLRSQQKDSHHKK